MLKKELKTLILKIKQNAPLLLVIIGAFFMSISGLHLHFRTQALLLDKELLTQHTSNSENVSKVPSKIFIEWFVDTSITQQIFIDNNWTISEKEASYLQQSAKPGEAGNIIIYGHNTKKILGNIRALKGNEIIEITTQDGTIYKYKISLIKEINPNQTEYLLPTTEETLTLYTCSGFLDKQRFIVQAKPLLDL